MTKKGNKSGVNFQLRISLASFPGSPQETESWAGAGNKAMVSWQRRYNMVTTPQGLNNMVTSTQGLNNMVTSTQGLNVCGM